MEYLPTSIGWVADTSTSGRMKFPGYVFTDYGSLGHLYSFHKVARNAEEAAPMALRAGVDLEAARPDVYKRFAELVRNGTIEEAQIDEAVRRILRVKFKAGLFEKPYADPKKIKKIVHRPEHVRISQEVAEESNDLIENRKSGIALGCENAEIDRYNRAECRSGTIWRLYLYPG